MEANTSKIDAVVREFEQQELSEELQETGLPVPESEMLSRETMEKVLEAKKANQSQFQSYWEFDENDLNPWTKQQIDDDPVKKFITMAENGLLSEMKIIMDNQKDWKSKQSLLIGKDSDGYTAMHRAAYSNQLEIVKYLVSFENNSEMPDVNQLDARTDMGWTPLHSAAYWNCFKIVEYLIKHANADVNAKSNSGQTCLHLAAQQSEGRETVLILLTNPNIDFGIRNDQGESARDIAIRSSKYNALFEITQDNLNLL